MGKIRKIRVLCDGFYKSQWLWEKDGKYIVTSYVNSYVEETMAFKADKNGEILDWGDLDCIKGISDHLNCAKNGFEYLKNIKNKQE